MITYFAYGSNMLIERLQRRCPSAQFLSTATASGHTLNYCKRSTDGSGKATIVAMEDPSCLVFGAVFQLSDDDLALLDEFEGRGAGYDRIDGLVVHTNARGEAPEPTTAVTYIAEAEHVEPDLRPYDWYCGLVLAGAHQHGLPEAYVRRALDVPCLSDPHPVRESRVEALDILAAAGFSDLPRKLGVFQKN